ncbi:ABC transporter substrate-binding protein [Nocardioides sp. BP30]|uniref:ABC transporter substrate-binding protein n=1 Tax=Nocardioides sp. BP30 TaxID=3036374 RepID=UPI0024685698|nr:ABC transporter substrate-binding protein [Nocardioides sp. BP30]WGL51572.1 ABC transporter substrate-binding protein [Nocardioides sp. BP30]
MKVTRLVALAAASGLTLTLAACGSDPTNTASGSESSSDTSASSAASGSSAQPIVVGSASFGESEILAEIYAQALKAKGIDASTHLDIGQREAYIGALKDGSISLFPEYTGNLLTYFDPKATATAPDEVDTALKAALPDTLTTLTPSAAEDKDSYNVTSDFAKKNNLHTIADLKNVSGLSLAGNPELKTRSYGVPGLESVYGITGIKFTPISDSGGPATLKALTSGKVDVADIYSTTPSISQNHLVTLSDPKNLVAAQNIVPLIRKDHDNAQVDAVLNAVSAKLTTQSLLDLNTKFNGPDKPKAADVAGDWLKANGLA